VLGIDPGITGGLGWVSWDGKRRGVSDAPRAAVATSANRKYDQAVMVKMVKAAITDPRGRPVRAAAAMELVHTMPGDGRAGSFSFGFGFAMWQGILTTLDVPISFVDPRRWQKEIGMEPTNDRRQRKTNSRLAAMKFFPEMTELFRRVKDDGRAEALIMAEWLRRKMVRDRWNSTFDMEAEEATFQPPNLGEDASNYKGKGGWVFKLRDRMKEAEGEMF
jgi:crossover junction endodeoxyribonuclease RuvC